MTVDEGAEYMHRMQAIGLGKADLHHCRRGCDCKMDEPPLNDPGEGERVSADGTKVYLTSRRMEP